MEILIVSATSMEIKPLLAEMDSEGIKVGALVSGRIGDHGIHVLITGIGMMHAAYHLGSVLERSAYDHIIQVGIAGAFDRNLKLTEVVEVSVQQFADLGFQQDGAFTDVFDMELEHPDQVPYWHGKLLNPGQVARRHNTLKKVTGVSVNSISADQAAIDSIVSKYDPDVEVMEGVSLHYACISKGVEYSEVRAISNYVEVRNKKDWKLEEAIAELNAYLLSWIKA